MIRAVCVAAVLAIAAGPSVAALEHVEREVYLMGTRVRIATHAPWREAGLATLNRLLGILEQAEDELSTWREHSAITALNQRAVGEPWQASAGLCTTFAELFRVHQLTDGAFDPAIGVLTDAWGIHEEGRVLSAAALAEARGASGLQFLEFDAPTCTVTKRRNVRIDVGAWGKGDALDRVRRAFPDVTWLIDLGGQVAVNGAGPDGKGWRLSIADPKVREQGVMDVWLRGGSISTSAGSERDLHVRGRRIAHHLDPRTGEPVTFNGSVSVWHADGLVADALSTALYVMGPAQGLRWAEEHGVAACFLEGSGTEVRSLMTSEFRMRMSPRAVTAGGERRGS